jgi:hypothetical protein
MVSPAPSLPKSFAQLSPAEAAELLAARKLPPVESWHPTRTGDSAMEIRADGSWYHEGGRINRPAMVKLFSTILRREPDGGHVLVTPAEKLAIAVEDTAFRAVEMKSEGDGAARTLLFRLDTDDLVIAGADHPLSFGRSATGWRRASTARSITRLSRWRWPKAAIRLPSGRTAPAFRWWTADALGKAARCARQSASRSWRG